jgi:hypothetical protein
MLAQNYSNKLIAKEGIRPVNNIISLEKYYKSCDGLLNQVPVPPLKHFFAGNPQEHLNNTGLLEFSRGRRMEVHEPLTPMLHIGKCCARFGCVRTRMNFRPILLMYSGDFNTDHVVGQRTG